MLVAGDALLQHVVIPAAGTVLTAQNQLDAGIEKLEGFSPLVRFFGVVFFGELLDLPVAPAFVT